MFLGKVTSGSIKIFLFLHLVKYLSTISQLSHIYNWLLILGAMQLILIILLLPFTWLVFLNSPKLHFVSYMFS